MKIKRTMLIATKKIFCQTLSRFVLCLLLLGVSYLFKAQNCNLVPNPSFENYSSCPKRTTPNDATKNEGLWLCDYWTYPTTGTPDFLHVCSNTAVPGGVGVPLSNFGYQLPHSGSGYGGFWGAMSSSYREYITSPLRCPLVAGKKYRIRFYVSPSGNNGKVSLAGSTCGMSGIGAYLSAVVPSRTDAGVIAVIPQVVSTVVIRDTLNWTKIEGVITATGGEQFITIGNFTDFANITFGGVGGGACGGFGNDKTYYFLDDVYVAHIIDNLPKDTFSFCVPTPVQLQVDTVCGDKDLVWTPAVGLNNPNIPNPIATPTVTTVYVVSNGCESDTVLIDLSGGITSTISATGDPCGGLCQATAAVSVSGGSSPYSYNWSNGSTSATQNNLCSGTYFITVTDASGCVSTTSIVLTQASVLTAGINAGTIGCNGGTTSATANSTGGNPGYTYIWSNSQTTFTATGITKGGYTVTVTDAKGCTTVATVTITEPSPITVSIASSAAVCGVSNGESSANVNGGSGVYTYQWSNGQTGATATGLSAGSYTVIVTDGNNCTKTAQASIGNTGGGTASASVQSDVSCNGGTDGVATVSITGGTPNYSYSWSSGAATQTAGNLSKGSYTVTVTDGAGCKSLSTVSISEPTVIILTTSSSGAVCGLSNGSATVNATGGTPNYSYSWSDTGGSTGQTITGVAAGSYTLTITDGNNCTKTAVAAVSNSPSPTINNITGTNLLCKGSNDGTATVSAVGGTGMLTYNWSNGTSGSKTINNLSANTYIVSVTDASGCTAIATVSITEPAALDSPFISTTDAACGQSNGSVTASASGGSGAPYTYSWSNATIGYIASNIPAGSYTVTVFDGNGCSITGTAIVANTGGPSVSGISSTPILCNGDTGSVTVTITGGVAPYTYSWSTGVNSITFNFSSQISNIKSGTYSVSISDSNKCQIQTTVSLSEPSGTTISFTILNASCGQNDGAVIAIGSGGTGTLTYNWSNTAAGPTANNLSAGSYTVTATDGNGCTKTATASVGNINAPTALASVALGIACNGGQGTIQVNVAGGSAPYSYNWSTPGGVGQSMAGIAAGSYTVTVTDAKGCIATSIVQLTQPDSLSLSISSQNTQCGIYNGSALITLTGGTSAFTYSWSNGTNSITTVGQSTATGLSPGDYTVTVTDANGCSRMASTTVELIPSDSIKITPAQQTIILGNSVAISVSGAVSYTWSPTSGLSCTNCSSLVATPTTTTIYTVTATGINGCEVTAMITITVKSPCSGNESDVFIANIFSPNNDGKNDVLSIEGNGLTNIYWAIYDRWGNLLFETFDKDHGWDGTKKGSPMDPGVYVYYLKATCIQTYTQVQLKGNVTIVR